MNNTSRTSVRTLVMLALLVAMSIVFSRVLSISTGFVRFNLGSLPVLLAALLFGPWAGFAVGAVADIIGGVLAGYAINPLGTLFAGAGFDQQGVHPVQLQRIGVHAAIGGAAVADDNIHQTVHPGFLGAAQLGQNAGALIDDGDQQAVIAAFVQKGGAGIIRHAGNILDRHWLQAHANTSAI